MSDLTDLDADEACRILIAVEEGRLYRAKTGRFAIDQEEPPDARTREELLARGLIVTIHGKDGHRITPLGRGALDCEIADRVRRRREPG